MAQRQDPDRAARADEAFRSGDFQTALRLYEPLLKRNPSPELLQRIGLCCGQIGKFDLAYKHMKRATELAPDVGAFCNLAVSAQMDGQFDAAHVALDQALKLDPEEADAVARKGNLHLLQGNAQAAYDFLKPFAEKKTVAPRIAVVFARAARAVKALKEGIKVIERTLPAAESDQERSELLFALGDVRDAAGEYKLAFDAYEDANSLQDRKFDKKIFTAQINGKIAVWSRDACAAAPKSRVGSELPVFIVGMPRSGTSLVEQILATHPSVFGAGELGVIPEAAHLVRVAAGKRGAHDDPIGALTTKNLDQFGRDCLRVMSRRAKSAKRVTDKMPENFLNLGLISLMFPKARVIHCTRDPLDTCLSCFFQLFGGNMQPFSYDLENLGVYYKGYRRLMAHWKEALDYPILDVSYEELVENQEAVSRRMVEFVGLDWTDECMKFHETARPVITASTEQVRQPMYKSSVARSKKYEKRIWDLKNAMA